MSEYVPLLVYLVISMVLSMLILSLSFVFSTQKADPEKVSAYECGFDPFDDARARFDIRFYLVAILFIIFDLEVTFLFPWAISLHTIQLTGFWTMVIFYLSLPLVLYMNGVKVLLSGNNFTIHTILICTLKIVCISILVLLITFFRLIPKD